MNIKAIVYTSNTGFTRRYAYMLAEKTGLPVYSLEEAKLEKRTAVIFMGWLMASSVSGYARARKKFDVKAVCGIGLCPTGELLAEVRRAAKIPAQVPLFTVQGGMDHGKLKGLYKFMIKVLVKALSGKKNATEGEKAMLDMIKAGGDFVDAANLKAALAWYEQEAQA